jgi:uncharacterized protein YndB with AHSA1/START domain
MIRETSSGQAELALVALDIRDGRSTVVFTRDFLDAPDRVWIALTDPEQLALWAPHTADRNLSSVGKVVFTMLGGVDDGTPAFDVPGAVLIADRPTTLEHSWGTDVLDWRLDAIDAVDETAGSTLTLRHTLSFGSRDGIRRRRRLAPVPRGCRRGACRKTNLARPWF